MFSGHLLVRSVILLRVRWPKIAASLIWRSWPSAICASIHPTLHHGQSGSCPCCWSG